MKTAADRPSRVDAFTAVAGHSIYPRGEMLCPGWLSNGPPTPKCITPDTSIVTLGSCFALETATWLKRHGYKVYSPTLQMKNGACTIYNTATMRQEFQRAFGSFEPELKHWTVRIGGQKRLVDPYRHNVIWKDEDAREKELAGYTHRLRKALCDCEVLILTVGQCELWYDTKNAAGLPMVPPDEVLKTMPGRYEYRLLGYDEKVRNLEAVYRVFREANQKARIIVTVSPVPLKLTFRGINSVVADAEQKAILRAAVGEFVRMHEDVWYFPSFELVKTACLRPYRPDNRHIAPRAVTEIMQVFAMGFIDR